MPEETLPAGRQVWTIKKLLEWSQEYLKKAKIDEPRLESELLLAHALGYKRIDLYIKFDQQPAKDSLSKFKEYIIRRKEHEPSAYITGNKPFMSLDINVTKDVLIPRPETELLVETAIDIAREINEPMILDIGTGSGAIAVSLAKYIPSAKVVATDLSEDSLKIAAENAKKHGVADKITFEKADLFPSSGKFNLIVSNPPYIRSEDIKLLAPEIKDHEPIAALDGGPDGLAYYRRILAGLRDHMTENGCLLLEVGAGQSKEVSGLISERSGHAVINTRTDLNGIERLLTVRI